jgi:hypothetical protein
MYNFIGIDVSKLTLQIYIEAHDTSIEIDDNEKSLKILYRDLNSPKYLAYRIFC